MQRISFMPAILMYALMGSIGTPLCAGAESRMPKQTPRIGCTETVRSPRAVDSSDQKKPVPQISVATQIDLLIAYTPAVLEKLGTLSALQDEIGRMVGYANNVHQNSGTGVTFRTVLIHPLDTNSSGTFVRDLESATFDDGVWDELLSLRQQYGADVVSVLVDGSQGGTLCGLGWTNGSEGNFAQSAEYMFNIVSLTKTCTRDTLVHEIGHNLGSDHERNDTGGATFLPYSFGYRFVGASRQTWHTVMAAPKNDPVIPFISTPNITFDGVPIGVTDSVDNVLSMSTAAVEVARLYDSTGVPDLFSPPPSEPNRIKATYKRDSRKRKVKITTVISSDSTPLPYQPVEIFYSTGKKGPLLLRALTRTDSQGRFTLDESVNIPPGLFYRSCYPGSSPTRLCTKPVQISKVR